MGTGELAGRTALVTGGSRGIGRAVCEALGRAGAAVAVGYGRDAEAAIAVRDALRAEGNRSEAVCADVRNPAAVRYMVETVEGTLGGVDLLVTSAGVAHAARHTNVSFEDWQRVMQVNVDGTFLPVMAVKDAMIERGFGRIVCLASVAALRPRPTMLAYSASKAAVIAFVRSAAAAFGPAVRVNGVAPGLIETDMTADMNEAQKAAMRDEAILKRLGRPEDIAETVLFLLSDRSAFTTGQTLVSDGGRILVP
jgi:3-oxoacyl-[acyl-carrier protein] reductase